MKVGILKESFPDERRVALVPNDVATLMKKSIGVVLQEGAGLAAGYSDQEYADKGAIALPDASAVYAQAEIILRVRAMGANPDHADTDLAALSDKHLLLGFLDPLGTPTLVEKLAKTGAAAFSVELIPRITRAQSMDALSSMANVAGYKAVIIAAERLPKLFPMMMTAAGTISAAKVFVLGAGVAGLQAIATAKRLGAIVEAYDVRPEVKEQVMSVGGKFVELELKAESGEGGYAKAQSADFYKRQQAELAKYIRAADVVITTAAIPGRKAPVLVTNEMMKGMKRGAVIVDLAAETGGNCEATESGKEITVDGVLVVGPTNVPSSLPYHASQMYSRNMTTIVRHFAAEGALKIDLDDEITAGALLTKGGEITNPRVLDALQKKAAS